MRTTISLLLASVCFATGVRAEIYELPLYGELPNFFDEAWRKKDAGKIDGQVGYSWINLEHATTGDVFSFVAWKRPGLAVDQEPVRQASIETHDRNGYALLSTSGRADEISELLRCRFVLMSPSNPAVEVGIEEQLIEYTCLYQEQDQEAAAIAHGYVVALGDFVIFLRHTSGRIIQSELARDMLGSLVIDFYQEKHETGTGWSRGFHGPEVTPLMKSGERQN